MTPIFRGRRWDRRVALYLSLAMACSGAVPATGARSRPTWTAARTVDPITGSTRCVVAAYDRSGKYDFSRRGVLYPIVEQNSALGLLVGASTGGAIRLPAGDILWRVDALPFRELRSVDNSVASSAEDVPAQTGNAEVDRLAGSTSADAMRRARAMMASSTVASGETARAMLSEMIGGTSLIFRSANAVPAYGLPSDRQYAVGQMAGAGLRPIPLDASFREALATCGIGERRAG